MININQNGSTEFSLPTVVGLLVALLGLPGYAAAPRILSIDLHPIVGIAVQWTLLGFVLWVVVRWEGRSLRSVGLRSPKAIDIGALLVATILGFLALAATGPLVDALGLTEAGQTGMGTEMFGIGIGVASAITTGTVEEVFYRGYAIERLSESWGILLAGGMSWAVFTIAHAPGWQSGDLVQIALAALVFTIVYVRRRSLVPVVGAHTLIWLLGILGTIYG